MQVQVQAQESLGRLTETVSNGVRPVVTQLGTVATEVKSEVTSLWRNTDERDDLIRTGVICGVIMIAVTTLVAITSWMPLWLRLMVVFATIGVLGKWLVSKIADTSDDM